MNTKNNAATCMVKRSFKLTQKQNGDLVDNSIQLKDYKSR